MRPCNNQFN